MMKNGILAVVIGFFAFFAACSDDDHNGGKNTPGKQVIEAFQAKYATASNVEWKMDNGYARADFTFEGKSCEAWFSQSGKWLLTETDLSYNQLPSAVKTGFEAGAYSTWKVEDVEMLERLNMPLSYRIEVEQGQQERTLYYDEEGNLRREADDNSTTDLPTAMVSFIQKDYPQSVIVDSDFLIDGRKIVTILDEGRVNEVFFASDNSWLQTQWKVLLTELPQPVLNTLKGNAFVGYTPIGAEFREYASGDDVYRIELQKTGSLNMFVEIYADGSLFLD